MQKLRRIYETLLTIALMGLYAQSAWAAFDETRGPFMDIICPVYNWFAALMIPVASLAFLVGCAAFLWGEELAGMTKKWITMIIAVAAALGGSAVVAWIGRKFGVMSQCF